MGSSVWKVSPGGTLHQASPPGGDHVVSLPVNEDPPSDQLRACSRIQVIIHQVANVHVSIYRICGTSSPQMVIIIVNLGFVRSDQIDTDAFVH